MHSWGLLTKWLPELVLVLKDVESISALFFETEMLKKSVWYTVIQLTKIFAYSNPEILGAGQRGSDNRGWNTSLVNN